MGSLLSRYLNWIVLVLVFLVLVLTVKSFFFTRKLGFVKTTVLIDKYNGMKEAKAVYQKKLDGWKSNIDTLEQEYRLAVAAYGKNKYAMSASEKLNQETYLNKLKTNLESYIQGIELQAKEEDQKLTAGVYSQINSLIEAYGKEHGYQAIFGATASGSVLYIEPAEDITDELVEELNQKFKGE